MNLGVYNTYMFELETERPHQAPASHNFFHNAIFTFEKDLLSRCDRKEAWESIIRTIPTTAKPRKPTVNIAYVVPKLARASWYVPVMISSALYTDNESIMHVSGWMHSTYLGC